MLWLDKFFSITQEKFPEKLKGYILASSKSEKNHYKGLLAAFNQMNSPEKALNYIGLENPVDPMSLAITDGFKYAYLAIHLFAIFEHCINHERIVPQTFKLVSYMIERIKLDINEKSESHAIKVTNRLINDFIDTKAPDISFEEVLGDDYYYIEFPRDFIFLQDSPIYCAFIHKTHVMIATKPWQSFRKYDLVLHEMWNPYHVVSSASGLGILFPAIKDQLFNVLKMIILYYKSSNNNQRTITIKPEASNKSTLDKRYLKLIKGAKSNINGKSHGSMFKLTYLAKPINDKNWRKTNTNEKKWQLDIQITVTGHWRWQAHGEKMSKRKLIYIQEHIRGMGTKDERVKVDVI